MEETGSRSSAFGNLLRRHRLEAGLSQEDLAERARISAAGVGALERGDRRTPQRETLMLLANALGLDPKTREAFEAVAKAAGASRVRRGSVTTGPWRAVPPSTLPLTVTSFVGREAELAEIASSLRNHRLVTLTGEGGSGKTRIALEVARALNADGDDVCFADLASITDASRVASAIASPLGVQEAPHGPVLEALLAFLERKQLLIVLDNCEHVIAGARSVAAQLLRHCAGVRILATSRESLSIAGERTHRLLPLPVEVAVVLFADRAASVDSRFAVTDENAPHIGEICRRLDGMPLALELAAARITMFSPQELAHKLDDRFRVLTSGDPTAPPRQETLQSLIDWSYDLLSEAERSLLRVLSAFAGGFTFAGAAAVYDRVLGTEGGTLDLLSSLVTKSLVHVERVGGSTRYRLLESMQLYARDRLTERNERAATSRAHALAFLELAEDVDDGFDWMPDAEWNASVAPELENWRAALAWSLGERGDVDVGRRLAGSTRSVWTTFAPAEGRQWTQSALQTVDAQTPASVVARLHLMEAQQYRWLGLAQASHDAAERAFALTGQPVHDRDVAAIKWRMGAALGALERVDEAEKWLRAALAASRQCDARKMTAWILRTLCIERTRVGDYPEARAVCQEALAIAREHGFDDMERISLAALGNCEFFAGDAQAALALAEEALTITQGAAQSDHARMFGLTSMSDYLLALGRHAEARSRAREALELCGVFRADWLAAVNQQRLAKIATLRPAENEAAGSQDRARAARLLGYAGARFSTLGAVHESEELKENRALLTALAETLSSDRMVKLMEEGRTWSEQRALDEALLV